MSAALSLVRCNRCTLIMTETGDAPVVECRACADDDALMDLGSPPSRKPYPTR